jgi:hypothetical protein
MCPICDRSRITNILESQIKQVLQLFTDICKKSIMSSFLLLSLQHSPRSNWTIWQHCSNDTAGQLHSMFRRHILLQPTDLHLVWVCQRDLLTAAGNNPHWQACHTPFTEHSSSAGIMIQKQTACCNSVFEYKKCAGGRNLSPACVSLWWRCHKPAENWYVEFQGARVSTEDYKRSHRPTSDRIADNSVLKENANQNKRRTMMSELQRDLNMEHSTI